MDRFPDLISAPVAGDWSRVQSAALPTDRRLEENGRRLPTGAQSAVVGLLGRRRATRSTSTERIVVGLLGRRRAGCSTMSQDKKWCMRDYDSDDEDVSASEESSEGTSYNPNELSRNQTGVSHDYVDLDSDGARIVGIGFTDKEVEQLKKLIGKGISYSIDRRPSNIIDCHQKNWVGVHFDSLKAGLRIPFDPFLVDFVNYYGIVPGQIAPNAHRILACYPQICKRHQVPCTLKLFNFLHLVKCTGKNHRSGFVIIQCRGTAGKVSDLPDNNRRWKEKFLRVRLDGDLPFKNEWSRRMRKCVVPPETPEIHIAVEKIKSECYSWEIYHSAEAFDAAQLPALTYGAQGAPDIDPELKELLGAGASGSSQPGLPKIILKKKLVPPAIPRYEFGSPGFPSTPFPPKSHGKRPIGEVESEVSGNAFATCPNLDGGSPLVSALTRAPVDLRKMFDLLLQLSPPPSGIATLPNEKVAEQLAHHLANVASTGAELFLRCQLTAIGWEKETQSLKATVRDQENQLESCREQISHLDAQLCSLGQYPNSDQFRRDAIAYFVSRPSEVIAWGYLKGTKGMQQTLYHILQNALHEDWESVRTILPEELTPPGPEPFKKPPTGPSSSRGQAP
nr:uncharacterized protein LOC109159160 [Ipomoea batatas]